METARPNRRLRAAIRWGVIVLIPAAVLAACGSSSPKVAATTTTTAAPTTTSALSSATTMPVSASNPMSVDPATKRVSFFVTASENGGMNFDGLSEGKLGLTVPTGWTVTVDCHNGGDIPHSCAIVSGPSSGTPAFPNAEVPDAVAGIAPGTTVDFTFTASTSGTYRLACLVPGHEDAGMWASFTVSPTATSPAIES